MASVTRDQPARQSRRGAGAPITLRTKLQPPPSGRPFVERDRLIAQLGSNPFAKVVVVDAPPGFGKTTLVAEWIGVHPDGLDFAWLALDREDNDPARFWTYVVEALRTVEPSLGSDALVSLRVPAVSIPDVVLPNLINELAELPRRIVLVLDDYHIVTNPQIHDAIEVLVDRMPSMLTLVLVTRSDPRLPLAQLRVRRELVEVRAEELRFTPAEARGLLRGVLARDLDEGDVERLQSRTEGWAAGLQLAALSLRGREDAAQFIADFAGDDRYLVDYLGAEVLERVSAEVRSFLLQTSILDRFSASLCDAVTGGSESTLLLREIERANLFLVPLDTKRSWYRYHQLFAELLRYELERTTPEIVPMLHRRAAAWLVEHGDVSEAIHHALLAGDVGDAAEWIALHWSEYLQRGRLETITAWLDALPPAVVAADPRLCLTRAWLAVNEGQIGEVDWWVAAAKDAVRQASGREPEDADALTAAVGMLRCIHKYLDGDVGGAIDAALEARELEPVERPPWRSVGCPVLGVALFWRGDSGGSADTLARAVARARPAGNHLAVLHAHSCLAASSAEDADWPAAQQLAQTALELGRAQGLDWHWANAMAHVALGKLFEQRGDLEAAEAEIECAVRLARRGVAKAEIAYALLARAQFLSRRGECEAAEASIREARRAVDDCPDPGVLAQMLLQLEQPFRVARRRPRDLSEELTDRELAVLRLLPTPLTFREIGSELYVSLNTVKTHCRTIYRKLSVSSRREAVERGKELSLL